MNNINSYCAICGVGYHACSSCKNEVAFTPWRAVVDTSEHYKVYTAIHEYTLYKNAKRAYENLLTCDLTDRESFLPEIQAVIDEIISEGKPTKQKKDKEDISVVADSKNYE